jgi:hypothetical protein
MDHDWLVCSFPEGISLSATTRVLGWADSVRGRRAHDNGTASRSCRRAMFLLKGFWSIISQGFTGTTEPEPDTGSPGKTPAKSTIVLGGGWQYDHAEESRVRAEVKKRGGPEQLYPGKMTVQGEQRALAAKTKAGAFDMRTPRRRPPSPRTPQASARKRSSARGDSPGSPGSDSAGARSPSSPGSRGSSTSSTPRSPGRWDRAYSPSPHGGDSLWNENTQGYIGDSRFKTLTAADFDGSAMRTPAEYIYSNLDPRGRSILYDP